MANVPMPVSRPPPTHSSFFLLLHRSLPLFALPLRRHQHPLPLQQLRQAPILMHRHQNIAPPNKLPINIELRNRGPITKLLDPLPQVLILQDIERGEFGRVDSLESENLDRGAAEAALGRFGRAFHEEDDGGGLRGGGEGAADFGG